MRDSLAIVVSKIEPPIVARVAGVRDQLIERIPTDAKYVAIVAPPGYGKSVLARELHDAAPAGTAAWLSVDLFDRQPFAFWSHLVESLRGTTAAIDDEPLSLLAERGTDDLTFVAALSAQVSRSPDRVTLVLDDVDRLDDAGVMSGLQRLGEWSNDRLRLVVTGRVDPALPLGRWRSQGLLADVRQADLRFDRIAARRVVESAAPGMLAPDEVDALNDRVEGWPVAIQVALLVAREAPDPAAAIRRLAGTDRLFADYLSVEVLDALTERQRDVALGLSVLEWFDLELCRDVLGPAAVPVARELIDRQVLLTELAGQSGFRFHSLVRELLATELRWRDPERHAELHRLAGEAMLRRDDRYSAMRHLLTAGQHDRASEVIAGPALALVDGGQVDQLRRALADLPPDMELTGAERIIDLALANFLMGRRSDVDRWVRRAIDATPSDDVPLRSRLVTMLLAATGAMGDGDGTRRLIDEGDRLRRHVSDDSALGLRHDAIVARAAVILDTEDVSERIAQLRRSRAPRLAIDVVAPALEALVAIHRGDLPTAIELHRSALASAESMPSDEHPAVYEALLAAGWCAWGLGEFDRALEFGDRAFAHPLSQFPMWWLRVASMVSDTLVRTGAADRALQLLDRLEPADAQFELIRFHADLARGQALLGLGRVEEARRVLTPCPISPRRDLLLAWVAARSGRRDEASDLLRESDDWPAHLRIEALVVRSRIAPVAETSALLARTVAEARRTGWIAPLAGHGPDVDGLLGSGAPSDPRRAVTADGRIELTERERTLLELLPTHLSYAQMGEQLYVSVNTIKSNLKSVYRKLGAGTRDEAIRAAERAGLLGAARR